jgi:uncharacterized protein (DUF1501 family)
LRLDDSTGVGLHPNLAGLKDLYDDGLMTIVQGVGYPNPNRSHFTSMDIWHTADASAQGEGWIGRYFDHACGGTPKPDAAIAIGRSAPLAMVGATQKPVTFESVELFKWMGDDLHETLHDPYEEITRAGAGSLDDPESQLAFLKRTSLDAQVSSDRIRRAVEKGSLVTYPRSNLAGQLKVIASMIRDGMGTRVYYASMGGFDTHANQAGAHANLMRQFGRRGEGVPAGSGGAGERGSGGDDGVQRVRPAGGAERLGGHGPRHGGAGVLLRSEGAAGSAGRPSFAGGSGPGGPDLSR